MTRFHGEVGFATSVEVRPGYHKEVMQAFEYFGDIVDDSRTFDNSNQINPKVSLGQSVSIVADDTLIRNFDNIRYVKWGNTAWTANSVKTKHPRLIISLGGVYTGEKAATASTP